MPAPSWFFRRLPLSLLGAALLVGCAQPVPIVPYEAEAGPYSARLLVRRGLQPRDVYGVNVLSNAQQCSGAQRLAIGSSQTPPSGTLLRAERLNTLTAQIVGEEGRCWTVLSFVPRTGRTYALTVASEDKNCWAYIFDVTDPDNTFVEPSVRRRNDASSLCRPLGTSTPPSANANAKSTAVAPDASASSPSDSASAPAPSASAPRASSPPASPSASTPKGANKR